MTTDEMVSRQSREVVAATWICLREGKVLVVRPGGQSAFYLPGGTPEAGETWAQTAAREVEEEVGISISAEQLRPFTEILAPAHGRPGVTVRLVCFRGEADGDPEPASEIEEVAWFGIGDLDRCAPAVQILVRQLSEQDLIG